MHHAAVPVGRRRRREADQDLRTFGRGQYTIGVKHELANASGAPISLMLYLQLVRDGTVERAPACSWRPPRSPARRCTPRPTSISSSSPTSRRTRPSAPRRARRRHREGRGRLDRHGAALLQRGLDRAGQGRARVPHPQGRRQPLLDRDGDAAGVAAGRHRRARGSAVRRPAREEAGRRWPGPRAGEGRHLHHDRQAAVLAARCAARGAIGNWGWAIVALVVLLKIAFYWLNASATSRWPR